MSLHVNWCQVNICYQCSTDEEMKHTENSIANMNKFPRCKTNRNYNYRCSTKFI